MAETAKGKKVVYVHPYTRTDGTRVPAHAFDAPCVTGAGEEIRSPSTATAEPLK